MWNTHVLVVRGGTKEEMTRNNRKRRVFGPRKARTVEMENGEECGKLLCWWNW